MEQGLWVWVFCVSFGRIQAQDVDVQVIRLRMQYDIQYDFAVNSSIEYMLEFVQEDTTLLAAPARVMLSSDTALSQHPITVSARQNNGAVMWQVPSIQATGGGHTVRYNTVERTLCPHNNIYYEDTNTTAQCDLETTDRTVLHVATTCSVSVTLRLRVEAVRDFYVALQSTITLGVAPASPRYHFYNFEAGALAARMNWQTLAARWKRSCHQPLTAEDASRLQTYDESGEAVLVPPQVQLVIESDDDVCAVVSIQNFSCPVFDNEREILYEGQYLTMMRSGGLQIKSSDYPSGFYLVFIVKHSDEDCTGPVQASDTPILEAILPDVVLNALGLTDGAHRVDSEDRRKVLRFRLQPSASYGQYLLATGLSLVVYGSFYALFVVSVFLFRARFMQRFLHSSPPPGHPESPATGVTYLEGGASEAGAVNTIFTTNGAGNPAYMESPRRRDSGATFDSSDMSDSDSEGETERRSDRVGPAAMAVDARRPFGLPAQLRLAALSRHRARVLRARSDRYLWTVLTVAVFYALPVVQLVATYQRSLNTQGDQDLCYYNFLCAHPLGFLSDFNHVISNLGYALLGLLFILQVARRQHRQRARADDEEHGIPQHYGILYAMGVALVVEAVLSGSYHVCPNQMNFQFDMAFMYVMAVLVMVKIYQSRHPDINARAHATFGVLALIITLCLWGVLSNSTFFWTMFTVIHLSTFLGLSLQIYYIGRFRLKGQAMAAAARELASTPAQAVRPLYSTRLAALLLANMANWFLAGWGLWNESTDIASHLLYVLLGNALLYTFFYIVMKLVHGERMRWHAWFFVLAAFAFWIPSMYYFTNGSTSWATTPAMSRQYNKPCELLSFFDSHDIWHFLSAIAMFMSFNMLLVWDDGLANTPRSDIAVF